MPKPINLIMSATTIAFGMLLLGGLWALSDPASPVVGGGPVENEPTATSITHDPLTPASALASATLNPPLLEAKLQPGDVLSKIQAELKRAHYVMVQKPRPVGNHEEAYAEGWEENAEPQSYLLFFRKVAGQSSLVRLETNPDAFALRHVLDGDVHQWSLNNTRQAQAFVGPNALRLEAAGPGGVALLGGPYRLELRDATGNPSEWGQLKGGGKANRKVPLFKRLAQPRQLLWALLSSDEKRLVLMERMPHSNIENRLTFRMQADGKAFALLP